MSDILISRILFMKKKKLLYSYSLVPLVVVFFSFPFNWVSSDAKKICEVVDFKFLGFFLPDTTDRKLKTAGFRLLNGNCVCFD